MSMPQLIISEFKPRMLGIKVLLAGGRVNVQSAPSGQRDLDFLAPAFKHIRELLVFDYDINDASAISSMKQLRSLNVGNASNLTVGALPDDSPLREVIMKWSHAASVLTTLPQLEHLAISRATNEAIDSIRARLSTLILNKPRLTGPVCLPNVTDKIVIHKLKHLDIRDLAFTRAPRRLQLEDIGSVSGLQFLPAGVEELILYSIGSADGSDLHGTPAKKIYIDGTGILPELQAWISIAPADLRQRANMDQATWDKLTNT